MLIFDYLCIIFKPLKDDINKLLSSAKKKSFMPFVTEDAKKFANKDRNS